MSVPLSPVPQITSIAYAELAVLVLIFAAIASVVRIVWSVSQRLGGIDTKLAVVIADVGRLKADVDALWRRWDQVPRKRPAEGGERP